jgi:hypothetical protein
MNHTLVITLSGSWDEEVGWLFSDTMTKNQPRLTK